MIWEKQGLPYGPRWLVILAQNGIMALDDVEVIQSNFRNRSGMIRDTKELERFEREYLRSERPDYERNLRIYEALWEEAVALGVLPTKDPLEGLETKILLARALNVPTDTEDDCGDA